MLSVPVPRYNATFPGQEVAGTVPTWERVLDCALTLNQIGEKLGISEGKLWGRPVMSTAVFIV